MFEGWLSGLVFPWRGHHQHFVSVRKVDNRLWAVFVLWFGCFEFCGKKRLLDHILKDCYIMFPNFSAGPIWLSCNKNHKGFNSDGKKKSWITKEQMTHWSSSVCLGYWSCPEARMMRPIFMRPVCENGEMPQPVLQSSHNTNQNNSNLLLFEKRVMLFWAVSALLNCRLGLDLTLRCWAGIPP